MLAIGIIMFLVGLTLRVSLNLCTRYDRDMLSPRRMSERMAALDLIYEKRRVFIFDANLLIAVGTLITLFTGVFN